MIFVIADDISGAAEIAAVGKQYGLTAQVQTQFAPNATVDLIAIDAHTRSSTAQKAKDRFANLSRSLSKTPYDWCYKKVDSVLRGHVHVECSSLAHGLRYLRTLLVPANPSKGRILDQGHYLIQGRPLDQTEFAHDPEYPARTSDVNTLLQGPIHLATSEQKHLPDQGIIVGQTQNQEHLHHWAKEVNNQTLPAGAVDFFTALLQVKQRQTESNVSATPLPPQGNRLVICGSTSPQSLASIQAAQGRGWAVVPMPSELTHAPYQPDESLIQTWAANIVIPLAQQGRAMIHIPGPIRPDAAACLRDCMAEVAQKIQNRIRVTEWVIEGGATARAILDRLAWHTLNIQGLYGPGVVQMQVEGQPKTWVTLKPGSYPWPQGWFC